MLSLTNLTRDRYRLCVVMQSMNAIAVREDAGTSTMVSTQAVYTTHTMKQHRDVQDADPLFSLPVFALFAGLSPDGDDGPPGESPPSAGDRHSTDMWSARYPTREALWVLLCDNLLAHTTTAGVGCMGV